MRACQFRPQNQAQTVWRGLGVKTIDEFDWFGLKQEICGFVDTWWHLKAYVKMKQSPEGTGSIGTMKKNLDGCTPRTIWVEFFI